MAGTEMTRPRLRDLADPTRPSSLASRFRARRSAAVRALIAEIAARNGRCKILDLGGTPDYWVKIGVDFLREHKVRIEIVNREPGELGVGASADDLMSLSVGDACSLPRFADNSFDLVHSNSVIEHLHGWKNMIAFAAETRRLSANYYIQTPYFWCPIDPHFVTVPFFHWLPRPVRAQLLNRFPIAHSGRIANYSRAVEVVEGVTLLDRKQFAFLFPDADIHFERVIGLPKSLIATRIDPASTGTGEALSSHLSL